MMKKETCQGRKIQKEQVNLLMPFIYAASLLGQGTSLARFLVLNSSLRQLLRTTSIWPRLLPLKLFSVHCVQLVLSPIPRSPRQY